MKFKLLQKTALKPLFFFSIIFCCACTSKNQSSTIDEEDLNVKVHEEEAQNPQKRNKNKLEGLLIKKADSFYFANNFKQARTLYDMALNTVTDAETRNYLLQKIAETKGKIEEKIGQDSIENQIKK